MTAFLRSKGSLGLGVEEQHDRATLEELVQADRFTRFIQCREVVDMVANVHETTVSAAEATGRARSSTSIVAVYSPSSSRASGAS